MCDFSILFKICENLDFGRNLRKSRLGSKFAKNIDFGRSFPDFGRCLEIISILVLFCGNLDFGRKVQKSRFCSKFAKISVLVELCENLVLGRNLRKISILVEVFENLDFGRNLEKKKTNSILV